MPFRDGLSLGNFAIEYRDLLRREFIQFTRVPYHAAIGNVPVLVDRNRAIFTYIDLAFPCLCIHVHPLPQKPLHRASIMNPLLSVYNMFYPGSDMPGRAERKMSLFRPLQVLYWFVGDESFTRLFLSSRGYGK